MSHPNQAELSFTGISDPSFGRVRIPTKLLYGIGEIGVSINMVVFGLFVLFFYNSVMKLPAALVGVGSSVGLVWDAIIDPYIGYRSDNCLSRLGRRHGCMLIGTMTMGLCLWLLLSPPRNLGTVTLFCWLLGTTLLFRLTSALYRIPYLSLGAELSDDYDERTSIVGIRSFFGLLGTLVAASLSFAVFFGSTIPGVNPKLDYSNYPRMALVLGLVLTLSGLVAVSGTLPCRSVAGLRDGSDVRVRPDLRSFVDGFRVTLRNPSFRSIWFSFSLFFLAVVLNSVLCIHFVTWYARISDSRDLSKIQSCFYLGALAGVAFWVWISKRAEKRALYFIATVSTGAVMCAATILFGEGHYFGTGNARPLFVGNALAGCLASALWVLPASMLADIADEDELHTGLRRAGMFFGLLAFGEKVAAGFSLLVSGLLLEYFVRLAPGDAQGLMTIRRIGVVYGLVPGLMLFVAALIILGYGLDRQKLLVIQTQLSQANQRHNFWGELRI